MAPDRDAQAVKFVKPDMVYRSSLPVSQDDGFTDYLCLSLAELGQDGGRSRLDGWHDRAWHTSVRNSWRIRGKGMSGTFSARVRQAADGFVHNP